MMRMRARALKKKKKLLTINLYLVRRRDIMGFIIRGKDVANHFMIDINQALKEINNDVPTLAMIRVGNHPSEVAYERSVIKKLQPLGIECQSIAVDEGISQTSFDELFYHVNSNPEVNAILVLKPLPKQLKLDTIIANIDPNKDVDCIGVHNMAKMYQEGPKGFIPCTAEAVMKILSYQQVELVGKEIVMIGFGMVIGRPLTLLLLESGSTVTVCNEFTKDLKQESQRADVLIVATGVAHLIKEEHVKSNAVVIDVGINVDKEGRLVGDVEIDRVLPKASAVTPVPGGVGTVTTYVLAQHVVEAYRLQHPLKNNLTF